ncbi:hypothetical protein [Haloarcula saliterrae]|nr:hypothetical protein [Haloarcula sp. S1CR25-12]
MAPDRSDQPTEDCPIGPDRGPPQLPAIAHLTVVPENADPST